MYTKLKVACATLSLSLAVSGALTSGALAEGGQAPRAGGPIVLSATAYDWSGAYAGLGISQHSGDVFNGFVVLDDVTVGTLFAGYAFQTGNFVYGVELAYSRFDQNYVLPVFSNVDGLRNSLDASVRLGYAFDNILFYALAGHSRLEAFNVGPGGPREADATGFHHGLGVAYGVNDRFELSFQYVTRDLSFSGGPGNPDVDAEHQTFSVRAAYRF